MTLKLSIIVPIYGVEKYIEKCLASCINQGCVKLGTDYEIICVNDGTKDKSADIARKIASQHDGITVLNQENQGLSVARNKGTSIAKGDYIWYVDSDDYIEEDCLERILPKLKDNLDILQLKWDLVYEGNTHTRNVDTLYVEGRISGKKLLRYGRLVSPAQFTILRKEFLEFNNLEFVKGIYHEDAEFKPRASYLAEAIEFDEIVSYHYLQRTSGSIMSTYRPQRMYDSMIIVQNLVEFMNTTVDEADRKQWAKSLSGPMSEILYLANYANDSQMIADARKFIIKTPECLFALTCSSSPLLKFVGYLSKYSKLDLFNIYRLLYKVRYIKKN